MGSLSVTTERHNHNQLLRLLRRDLKEQGESDLGSRREHELPQWFLMACSFKKAFVFPTVQCIYDICFSLGFLN